MRRPRFQVISTTGYDESHGKGGAPSTDYYVVDAETCYRVVASFPARPGLRPFAADRKRKAGELADTLNRGDEAWRDALAREGEFAA